VYDVEYYFQGSLVTAILLGLEHAALYARLRPRGDAGDTWRVLLKFVLGVLAILAGCALIAYRAHAPEALFGPLAASAGGLIIVFGYIGRWTFERGWNAAETRGWLKGLADKADIAAGEDGDGA
jgi:hypothetical protein